ncbi:MAG: hypothetical protein GQ564_02860 [Bacteroidales bacterium]|nr:hypothetical protein [Bacteroidales bacterium]
MVIIKTKVSIKDKELIQIQYITDHFIVTELNGRKLIFISGNTLFFVDIENKSLKEIDISSQVEQINKVKAILGELKIESINKTEDIAGYKTKGLKVYNINNDAVKFLMNTAYAKIPGIEETVYPEFMKIEQGKQLVNLDIEQDEVLASMSSEIYMQGNLVQEQSMEIIDIKTDLEDNEKFYEYLSYSHEQ